MTKYLAVIKDSFREALASRVLWLLLVLITLLLLVIAPLGYNEVITYKLGDSDVRGWEHFMHKVRTDGQLAEPSPSRKLFTMFDEDVQRRIVKVKIPEIDEGQPNPMQLIGAMSAFQKATNEAIEASDFYDDESFASVALLSEELTELKEVGPENLNETELPRFNRLVLEASFPELVRSSPPTSIQLKYGWWEFFEPFPLRSTTLRETIQSFASIVMAWFVGAIGVLVAILVTSPIVPQMFDPGALHLLLSKPISRWLLFLAKFCGGCAFICICSTYLVTGLWLILGVRFGVWDPRFLLAIPIYLFVFAIYYSVSALCGVMYRSPVVCIVLTVLFWGICFGVGTTKVAFEGTIWTSAQLTQVFDAGDSLMAVNEVGVTHEWDDEKKEWNEVFLTQAQKRMRGMMIAAPELRNMMRPIGPIYDEKNDRVLAAVANNPRQGSRPLQVGSRTEEWEPASENSTPTGTQTFLKEPDGKILLVSSVGLFRLTGDPLEKKRPVKLFGIKLPLQTAGPFENVSPIDTSVTVLTRPSDAAISNSSGTLALYTRGTITLLQKADEGKYEPTEKHRLDGKEQEPVVLAIGGNTILLGRQDGRVQALDAATFEEHLSLSPEGPNQVRFIKTSPDGRWFSVLFHNGNLWIFDAESNTLNKAKVSGQGGISAATFSSSGNLYVADRAVRVTEYSLPDFSRADRFTPRSNLWLRAYRYVVVPLYTVFPKPGELGTTFDYFLSGKETQQSGSTTESLSASQRDLDPWTPLWSSAIFMIVVLVFACVYIERQEF